MNPERSIPDAVGPGLPAPDAIPALVAEVYAAAPTAEQGRLLETLLRPLGVLSLVAVADGIFAKVSFRSGWPGLNIPPQELERVHGADVAALVDHVQQVSVETVDGLVQTITTSPLLAGSAAAAVLVTLLLRRARARQTDRGPMPSAGPPATGFDDVI